MEGTPDEAIDPLEAPVILSAGTIAFWGRSTGRGDAAHPGAGGVRADALRFGSLCCPFQTLTTSHSDGYPTPLYAHPSPNGNNCPQSDGDGNSNESTNQHGPSRSKYRRDGCGWFDAISLG